MQQTDEERLHYFVGHQTTPEKMVDLRGVIDRVFGSLGYEPYYANEVVEGQTLLLKITQRVLTTGFSVLDLASSSPNVYIEMGIALALNKPIIAIAKDDVRLPSALQGQSIIRYADYYDLEVKLSSLRDQGIRFPASSVSDFCPFCGRICEARSSPPDQNAYLVLDASRLLWRDLMRVLEPYLAERRLIPVYLTDQLEKHFPGPILCAMRRKVLEARFVMCHPGALADDNSYLAMGMAVGHRLPWILLSKKEAVIPSNLLGLDRFEYTTLGDLEARVHALDDLMNRVTSHPTGKRETVTRMSLPLWETLDLWIDREASVARAPKELQGQVRLILYKGRWPSSRYVVPKDGLLVGRSPECAIVIESQDVSARHFRILRSRTGKYFLEDLKSSNGTYHNGERLPRGGKAQLNLGDTIRVGSTRFRIWDDRPLPEDDTAKAVATLSTDQLPPIPRLEIADLPVPEHLPSLDYRMFLRVRHPDPLDPLAGNPRTSAFDLQAYYPLGRVLSELVRLLGLPNGLRYRLWFREEPVESSDTPLSIKLTGNDELVISAEPEPRVTILLAYSDPDDRAVMKSYLENQGYVVVTADDRSEVMSCIQQESIDLTVLDLALAEGENTSSRPVLVKEEADVRKLLDSPRGVLPPSVVETSKGRALIHDIQILLKEGVGT